MPRPAGTPNKIGRAVKENVIAVFERIGGLANMAKWAAANESEFYRLYARLMPTEVISELTIRNADELSDSELANLAAAGSTGVAVSETGETQLN